MTTKERIMEQSLRLFSTYGYHAVSVRDVADAVGIKDSSLYNHFESKQDIFNNIVMKCFKESEEYFNAHALPFSYDFDFAPYAQAETERLIRMAVGTFEYFVRDRVNNMFRKLLCMSQDSDEKAKVIYLQVYKEYPLRCIGKIMQCLMDRGEIRVRSAEQAAREFYGVPFLILSTVDDSGAAMRQIEEHVEQFLLLNRIR